MGKKILKWVAIVVGGLIGLVVLVMIVGSFLSPDFSAEARISLSKPPDAVWAALNNPKKIPVSGEMCQQVIELPPQNGLPAWKEDLGGGMLTIRVVEANPPAHLVRTGSDSFFPMTMRSEISVTPQGPGSVVRVLMNVHVAGGSLASPILRVNIRLGAVRSGILNYLNAVAKAVGDSARAE